MLKRTTRGATAAGITPEMWRKIVATDPNNAGMAGNQAGGAAGQAQGGDDLGLLPFYLRYTQTPQMPAQATEDSHMQFPMMGGGNVTGPSLIDVYTAAKRNAIAAQPDPYGVQEAGQAGVSARNNMIESRLGEFDLPTKQWTNFTAPDMPQREQIPIPTRPAPQADLMSLILGALAGGVDPQAAGRYGAAPLEAGVNVANSRYNDSLQQYGEQKNAADQRYNDATAGRQEAIRMALMNREGQSDADYANQTLTYNSKFQGALRAGDEAAADKTGGLLKELGGQARAGAQAELNANTSADRITAMREQRGLQQKAISDEAKRRIDVGGQVLDYDSKLRAGQDKRTHDQASDANERMRIKADQAYNEARIGVEKQNAASGSLRAIADLRDKGFMLDKNGQVVRDPDAPKDDTKNLTKDEQAALTKARENFGSLYNELRREGKSTGLSGNELENYVSDNVRLKALSKQIRDLEGKAKGGGSLAAAPVAIYDPRTKTFVPGGK